METRSKRRRLMSISSNVSSWPDVPARFESLNDDTLTMVLEFVGDKSYRSFGGLNYHCKEIYITSGMAKKTYFYGYAPLSVIIKRYERRGRFNQIAKGVVLYNRLDVFEWTLQHRKKYVLKGVCNVAAEEGRIDILDEMWNFFDDDRKRDFLFSSIDDYAARGGKLNVLKWFETKGISIYEEGSANIAAEKGNLHILKWLQEEKGFELDGELYDYAIDGGGQLLILKWLREQEVPWNDWTFSYAVRENGNLDILQWLHNEGCPWNHRYRVDEHCLNPEVIDWCRVNGYSARINRIEF